MALEWWDWPFLMLGVSCALVAAYRWYAAARVYTGVPLLMAGRMLRYTCLGHNRKYLRAAVRINLFLSLMALIGFRFPGLAIIIVTSLILCAVIGFSIPPVLLLLGSSKTETALLMEDLNQVLYPLRVVALLDPHDAHWTV